MYLKGEIIMARNGKTPTTYKKHTPTSFELKWGITSKELAKQEGVTIDCLHMRVHKFGTPWQRKAKPNSYEAKYGRSLNELSEMLNMHPVSVALRERAHGNVFYQGRENVPMRHNHSYEYREVIRNLFWLHPNHPDYATERSKLEEFKNGKEA